MHFFCLPVGIPDLPRQCFLNFVNQTKCGISCYPGYLGGEEAGFAVYSTTLHGVTKRLDTVMIWNDSLAVMVSEGLQPNTSYTIRIFGENIHGESEEAIGLYIRTPGKYTRGLCSASFSFFFHLFLFLPRGSPSACHWRFKHPDNHHNLLSDWRCLTHCHHYHHCCVLSTAASQG